MTCTPWILILPEWRSCVKISQEHVEQSHPKQCNAWSQLTFSVTYLNCQNISMLVKFEFNCVWKNLYCFASVAELEYTNIILNKQFCPLLRILWKSFTNSCVYTCKFYFFHRHTWNTTWAFHPSLQIFKLLNMFVG